MLHFRYDSLVALSTLSPIRYLLRPKTRFPVRRLYLLSGREFHPLEAPGLSWRTVMQVEVRQQRTHAPTLNRSHFTLYPLTLLQHACLEPFVNQAHDAPVCYAMLDKLPHPSVIERVIKPPDVGIEHPVHSPRSDPNRQRIQRLVRTTSRSKSIGESQKVLFVDRVQHLDRGTLDDLIFQRRNPEWAKPPGLPTFGM